MESVNGVGLRVFTVAQWFDQFVKQKQKSRADKTAAAHGQVRNEFIEFLGPRAHENTAGVSSEDIAAFRDHRELLGLAPNTLNKDIDVLSAAFNAALKQGLISVNPCAVIEDVKDKLKAGKEIFTLEQETALGKTAPASVFVERFFYAKPCPSELGFIDHNAVEEKLWHAIIDKKFSRRSRLHLLKQNSWLACSPNFDRKQSIAWSAAPGKH